MSRAWTSEIATSRPETGNLRSSISALSSYASSGIMTSMQQLFTSGPMIALASVAAAAAAASAAY